VTILLARDFENILELFELTNHLFESLVFIDKKKDDTALAVLDRKTKDGFHIEGTAGKKPTHVRHDTGVVSHEQAQHGSMGITDDLFVGSYGFMRFG
jgi:hypothetical protein